MSDNKGFDAGKTVDEINADKNSTVVASSALRMKVPNKSKRGY